MAQKQIRTRVQLRNDTAANWTSANPVLMAGELGVETDTRKMKIGDGTKTWSNLSYIGVDNAQIQSLIDAAEDNFTEVTATSAQTDAQAIAAAISSPSKGDIAVVKRPIGSTHNSYTGYVYSGSAWGAMDGNYNAENVYFNEDLTYTKAIGELPAVPSSGSATLQAKDKNVKQVLSTILAKATNPSVTNPTAKYDSCSFPSSATVEPGTSKSGTVSYDLGLASTGSYTYGPAVQGVSATGYSMTYNDGTTTGSKTTETGSFNYNFTVGTSNKSVSISSATVSYSAASNYAVNNLGETTTIRVEAGSASAGTKTCTFTSSRKTFWAADNTTGTDLDQSTAAKKASVSYMLRGLASKEFGSKKSIDLTIAAGTKRVIVAIPGTVNWTSSGKGCEDVAGMNLDVKDTFTRVTGVKVGGADSTSESIGDYEGDYTVFYREVPAGLAATTYKIRFA